MTDRKEGTGKRGLGRDNSSQCTSWEQVDCPKPEKIFGPEIVNPGRQGDHCQLVLMFYNLRTYSSDY